MNPKPYTVRKSSWNRRPAILLTFTGTTEAEYDIFLDARFTEGGEPIGFRRDSAAPGGKLLDEEGREQFNWRPFQFRAEPPEPTPEPYSEALTQQYRIAAGSDIG